MDQQRQPQQGAIYIWGLNVVTKNTSDDTPTIVKSNSKHPFVTCSSGNFCNIAVNSNGEVFAFGSNKYGRIGLGQSGDNMPITRVQVSAFIVQVSCGNWHSLLLSNQGQVYAAGHNKTGALGIGSSVNQSSFQQLNLSNINSIAAGDGFSLFMTKEGQVLSCGNKARNGLSSKDHQLTPALITKDQRYQFIACGFSHAGMISVEGHLYTWGSGSCFQLGHGDNKDQITPKLVVALENVTFASFSRGEKYCHSAAIAGGQVYTWGSGYKGKLGHQVTWSHAEPADEPIPRVVKEIPQNVKAIYCGGIHSALHLDDGKVLTFGCGSGTTIFLIIKDGRLGHPESKEYTYLYKEGKPREIMGLNAISLCCSYYHNIAIGFSN